jgi:hypothetical protein
MTQRKLWTVTLSRTLAADLERELRAAQEAARAERERLYGQTLELFVDRYRGLRITIRANEHPPPHFHVECDGGEASFRISDGQLLAGNLSAEVAVVRKWFARNRPAVINLWNQSRPSGCPVGPYVE